MLKHYVNWIQDSFCIRHSTFCKISTIMRHGFYNTLGFTSLVLSGILLFLCVLWTPERYDHWGYCSPKVSVTGLLGERSREHCKWCQIEGQFVPSSSKPPWETPLHVPYLFGLNFKAGIVNTTSWLHQICLKKISLLPRRSHWSFTWEILWFTHMQFPCDFSFWSQSAAVPNRPTIICCHFIIPWRCHLFRAITEELRSKQLTIV